MGSTAWHFVAGQFGYKSGAAEDAIHATTIAAAGRGRTYAARSKPAAHMGSRGKVCQVCINI